MLKISDELDTIVQEGQFEQALESVSRGLETSTGSGKDIGQLQLLGLEAATALSSGGSISVTVRGEIGSTFSDCHQRGHFAERWSSDAQPETMLDRCLGF